MTSFFSRDAMLKRQGIHTNCCSSESNHRPLNIILEEDEHSRSSSPTSCYSLSSAEGCSSPSSSSSNLSIKAKRRHATVSVSELRLSRVFPTDDDILLSTPPRPAPPPPTTPSNLPPASPDSFRLTFTDVSFKFPHPPIPTPSSLRKYADCHSPTSSLSSSPASQTDGPLTPSASDDEFGPSPQRPQIQPLVITKHNPRPSSLFDEDCALISPSLLQPFKNATESSVPISPLSPSYLPEAFFGHSSEEEEAEEEISSDSEPESDSEWYTKELSKIISLRSPIPPSFPHQTSARPDSISFSSSEIPFTASRNRASKPLPPTPLSGGFPSPQLDPAYPRRKGSKRRTIPNYPPPPVPSISLSTPSPTSSSSSSASRRPPPRSSIPADCIYDLADVEPDQVETDTSSAFSFSIYDVYLGGDERPDSSLPSAYSQVSFGEGEENPMDGVSFDLDSSMMLPLSLPTTPFDLEADIAQGLERLRRSPDDQQQPFDFVVPEIREPELDAEQPPSSQPQPQPSSSSQPQPQPSSSSQPQVIDDIFSPPTTPDDKILKSRWSTSTLGSIREDHEPTTTPSKLLRLYFSPLKNHTKHHGSAKKSPTTSCSIASESSTSPLRSRKTPVSSSSSPTTTAPSPPAARSLNSKLTRAHIRGYSDVMVIGYGNNGHNNGVRRRGSLSNKSVSDAGSEESWSSSSSSGLRRKPIPVEMFLRSAV